MTKSHTPGPWRIKKGSESGHCCFEWSTLAGPECLDSAVICEGFSDEANASLIAAAPELLEALDQIINPTIINGDKEISVTWETLAYGEKVIRWETAKKAIAKAKGETK